MNEFKCSNQMLNLSTFKMVFTVNKVKSRLQSNCEQNFHFDEMNLDETYR